MRVYQKLSWFVCISVWCGAQPIALGQTAAPVVRLSPASAVIKAGDTVALKARICEARAKESGDQEAAVEPLCPDFWVQAEANGPSRWLVNGIAGGNAATIGRVAATIKHGAVYTAPPKAPKNPVDVSVEYLAPGSKEKQLLIARITVIDPNANCAALRDAGMLQGGMTFAYEFSGTDAQGHTYKVSQSARLDALMKRVPNNPAASTWVWRGPARSNPSLLASMRMGDATQTVRSGDSLPGSSEMTVTVRVKDCSYVASAHASAKSTTTLDAGGIRNTSDGNTVVGRASTGVHAIASGMSGSGKFSLEPQDRETSGSYHAGGFGNTLLAGFKSTELGTATVTWVVGLATSQSQ